MFSPVQDIRLGDLEIAKIDQSFLNQVLDGFDSRSRCRRDSGQHPAGDGRQVAGRNRLVDRRFAGLADGLEDFQRIKSHKGTVAFLDLGQDRGRCGDWHEKSSGCLLSEDGGAKENSMQPAMLPLHLVSPAAMLRGANVTIGRSSGYRAHAPGAFPGSIPQWLQPAANS